MVQDPAGLLQRIVELEPLVADPGIRRAVGTGDPLKVYRALVWARLTGRLASRRGTLDLLVRNRRAFARPISGKLWLGTLNGFGATLLGGAEKEPDGTRIATHYVVAFFIVPLFPLGAYVVAGGERSGLSTSWNVFARVPLAAGTWLWSRAVALGAAAAIAAGAVGAFHVSRHHDVHVVNGFAVPLDAAIGDTKFQVPARGRHVVNVPAGTWDARATAAGAPVDEGRIDVTAGSHVLVWNVAGAAPVFRVDVEYFDGAPPANHQAPEPTYECGKRIVTVDGVDAMFQPPPEKVSMSKSTKRAVRRYVDVDREGTEDGALGCASFLVSKKRPADAIAILEQRARLAGWADVESAQLLNSLAMADPADAARVTARVRQARPDDTRVHRIHQTVSIRAGREAEVLAEYRGRAEAAPGSATAQYLHARLLRGAEQSRTVNALAASFPGDPDLLRLATAVRCEDGDWRRADESFRALLAKAPDAAGEVLEEEAIALVAQGRRAEALRVLRGAFDRVESARERAAALYARVAALGGDAQPDALVAALEAEPERLAEVRAIGGLPVTGEPLSPVARVVAAAGRDPAEALAAVTALDVLDAWRLDGATWALLYGEALRVGAAPARDLLARTPRVPGGLDAFERYVRGEDVPSPTDVELQIGAAAALVRSRNPGLPAAERERLVSAALHDDWLRTNVTRAARAWHRPDASR